MKTIAMATAAYESPECEVIEICSKELICTSTEGYELNHNGLDEDDWE